MGLAHDLLVQADHLAKYEGPNRTQAALRRAVSTAYYALFHLRVEDAAQRWHGSAAASTGLERAFQHGPMKNVSKQFDNLIWKDWHGNPQSVPPALQLVAGSFVRLQEDRHAADYDNHEPWLDSDVQEVLETAQAAFPNWLSIRADPMAGNYLLAMLLNRQRP